ncbi:MAG TPA: carboxypeptidase-like regulatory domain-containing protein [Pirellulales bacterium]|nr:carboxypeptidase-like regulatory domain-containing protein [Pirellulales bacterium]
MLFFSLSFRSLASVLLAIILISSAGCNSSGVQLGSVTGRITKNGKPQPKVSIFLTPLEGGRGSEGLTNENGEYQMVYTRDLMGALVGKQRLTVSTAPKTKNGDIVSPGMQLVSKEVEIKPGSNTFDYDLAESEAEKSK